MKQPRDVKYKFSLRSLSGRVGSDALKVKRFDLAQTPILSVPYDNTLKHVYTS